MLKVVILKNMVRGAKCRLDVAVIQCELGRDVVLKFHVRHSRAGFEGRLAIWGYGQ